MLGEVTITRSVEGVDFEELAELLSRTNLLWRV